MLMINKINKCCSSFQNFPTNFILYYIIRVYYFYTLFCLNRKIKHKLKQTQTFYMKQVNSGHHNSMKMNIKLVFLKINLKWALDGRIKK